MPIEVKELIIKAVVTHEQEVTQPAPTGQLSQQDRDEIIQDCVKQTLQILKKSQER